MTRRSALSLLLMDQTVGGALVLSVIAFVFYVPLGYYKDPDKSAAACVLSGSLPPGGDVDFYRDTDDRIVVGATLSLLAVAALLWFAVCMAVMVGVAVGPREDGTNLWKVQVGGMDMATAAGPAAPSAAPAAATTYKTHITQADAAVAARAGPQRLHQVAVEDHHRHLEAILDPPKELEAFAFEHFAQPSAKTWV